MNAYGGVAHTRWPNIHGLLNRPSRTSNTVRIRVCVSPLSPTRARVLTVCRETQDACLRLQTGQSSTTEAALKVTLRCRTKVDFLAAKIAPMLTENLYANLRFIATIIFRNKKEHTRTAW